MARMLIRHSPPLAILLTLSVFLAACAGAAPAPTATPPPTATSVPSTVAPSPTPRPTATAVPSPTSSPTATAPRPTATAQPALAGPCGLMKLADIEAVFGALEAPPEPNKDSLIDAPGCDFVVKSGLFSVSQSTEGKKRFTATVDKLKAGGAPLVTLPGFGDEAVLAVGKPAPTVKGSAAVMLIRKGETVTAFSMLSDMDDPTLTAAMKSIAGKLAGK